MKKILLLFLFINLIYFCIAIEAEDNNTIKHHNIYPTHKIGPRRVNSIPRRGTLLEDKFGVTPELKGTSGGNGAYSFDFDTMEPTVDTATVDWLNCDWFGSTSGLDETNTVWGEFPSGGEPYDVEFYYVNNDNDNLYIAIITSVPHYWDYGSGNADVGIYETRLGPIWVRPGDISLNFFHGTGRTEKFGTWYYNYGLDITHENRDNLESYGSYQTCAMRDTLVGDELYKTISDPSGAANDYDPASGTSDWHVSTHTGTVEAGWEHTNFDPLSTKCSDSLDFLGDDDDGIITDYYELTFDNSYLENDVETFVIEATIPWDLFGSNKPSDGDSIAIRFSPGCRNDGDTQAIGFITTTIDYLCAIGDTVWYDFDADGLQDETGIIGVSNVLVRLYKGGETTPLDSMYTDTNGYYLFDHLIPGVYYIEFVPPTGWYVSPQNTGSDDTIDSDANQTTGQTGLYSLDPLETDLTVDCGLYGGGGLPVTLTYFTVIFLDGYPTLNWITQSETENSHWNIYRSVSSNLGQSVQVNTEPIPGAGTTSEPTEYSFEDNTLFDYIYMNDLGGLSSFWYWLESVTYSGETDNFGPINFSIPEEVYDPPTPPIPVEFGLFQNYPNPFNPITFIPFKISTQMKIELAVYDIRGRKIKTLVNNYLPGGSYNIRWDGRDETGKEVGSGLYLYRMKADDEIFTKKMIVFK